MRGICIWKAHPGMEEEFLKRWKYGSEVFQTYPGAQGTRLHRSLTDRSVFAGYATWESLEKRTEAEQDMEREHPELKTYSTSEVSEMLFLGFFAEPDVTIEPNPSLPACPIPEI